MAPTNYKSWTVSKLKTELILRGAVQTGRKTDLVDRLLSYDRNKNFQQDPIEIPDPIDIGWPKTGYKQLISEHRIIFAKVTREQIDGYFLYRLAGDRQASGDIKALEKGKDMFDGKRILACSVQVSGDFLYLSGIVGAAMKNKITYNYKLRLDKSSGSPVNSACECPAGKGPHATCKHIAATLLMIQNFSETGKIAIEKSCTEGLQTFNQPKKNYSGNPVTAEQIPLKRKVTEEILSDPRPLKYRNAPGYNDYVRNAMVNYCSSTSSDLALRYIYDQADIQAAQKDHNYLQLPFVEHWVDRALQITETDADKLEMKTRGQSANSLWFKERQWRITASWFGELSRITSRRNTLKLCYSMLHPKTLNTPPIMHGKMFEGKAIEQFQAKFNLKTKKCGLFVCVDKPYLGASPDAIIDNNSIVEVKCPYTGRNETIVPGEKFKFLCFNESGSISLSKSHKYYDQIQGQLFISKRELCFFVVYTFKDLFVEEIRLDRNYFLTCVEPKLDLFFTKHFRPFIAANL